MRDEKPKAKVFICCGQKRGAERQTAERIAQALEKIGFKTYVAVEQQRLEGLQKNIFRNLEDSEYFVFVDFKREALVPEDADIEQSVGQFLEGCRCQWRGSLFCHQELAVRSYLGRATEQEMQILAFHEKGVMRQDGMMNALIVNSEEFADRHLLPEVIAYRAQQKEWHPQWQRRLALTTKGPANDGTYCHIAVENLHGSKPAKNCYGHLKKAYDTSREEEVNKPYDVELKWAFSKAPNIVIFPKTSRRLDAFWEDKCKPNGINLSTLADTSLFDENIITDPGTYELTYLTISDNFPDAEITCGLEIGCDGKVKSFKEKQTDD